jgi:hypothetical protein
MRASAKFALLLCCLPALMGAQVYRWVDDKGVVNYTQQKPVGIPSELIEAATGLQIRTPDDAAPEAAQAPAAPSATGQPPAERLTEAQREALAGLEAAEQSRQAEVANIRAANCERAQGVLERLNTSGRIRVRDADGNETAMSEEEHQQRIAEAQRGVVENCID